MSFILDALQKVEKERRAGASAALGSDGRIARLENAKRRRHRALLVAIALVSAGLTAVVLRMFPSRSVEAEPTPVAAAATTAPPETEAPASTAATKVEPPSVAAEKDTPPSDGAASAAAVSSPISKDESTKKSNRAMPVRTTSRKERAAASEPVSALASAPNPAPPPPPPENPESAVPAPAAEDPVSDEPVTPIRLVGPASASRLEPTADASEPPPATVPAGEPHLILQGTSVVDGHPVAVISDRRVFEGDNIEGAVVIRIEERSVELEFEGRRFTLSL
jgi:hypothetical protein